MLEGYSYLLLFFVAMPLKYFAAMPEPVKYVGMLHGILVIAFVAFLIYFLIKKFFPINALILAFLLSLIPFGTFFLKRIMK